MPSKKGDKYERQYEHIKESQKDRGVAEERAKEIAGRTVNEQRRKEGQTRNARTTGTGNPNQPLEERSRDEVYNRAKELNVPGRSSMTKAQLVEEVRKRT